MRGKMDVKSTHMKHTSPDFFLGSLMHTTQ